MQQWNITTYKLYIHYHIELYHRLHLWYMYAGKPFFSEKSAYGSHPTTELLNWAEIPSFRPPPSPPSTLPSCLSCARDFRAIKVSRVSSRYEKANKESKRSQESGKTEKGEKKFEGEGDKTKRREREERSEYSMARRGFWTRRYPWLDVPVKGTLRLARIEERKRETGGPGNGDR